MRIIAGIYFLLTHGMYAADTETQNNITLFLHQTGRGERGQFFLDKLKTLHHSAIKSSLEIVMLKTFVSSYNYSYTKKNREIYPSIQKFFVSFLEDKSSNKINTDACAQFLLLLPDSVEQAFREKIYLMGNEKDDKKDMDMTYGCIWLLAEKAVLSLEDFTIQLPKGINELATHNADACLKKAFEAYFNFTDKLKIGSYQEEKVPTASQKCETLVRLLPESTYVTFYNQLSKGRVSQKIESVQKYFFIGMSCGCVTALLVCYFWMHYYKKAVLL